MGYCCRSLFVLTLFPSEGAPAAVAGTHGVTDPDLYRSRCAFQTATLAVAMAVACAAISLERFSRTMAKMAASPHHCRF